MHRTNSRFKCSYGKLRGGLLTVAFIYILLLARTWYSYPKTTSQLMSILTTSPSSSNRTIYQRTLFVIDGSRHNLRLTSLRKCTNKDLNTVVKLGGIQTTLKPSVIIKCPWGFAPKCDVVGFYGQGYLSTVPQQLPTEAHVLDITGNWQPLEVVDARIPRVKPHKLAVCLQPIYLMADWAMIPHFFETWIEHGATYFLIYVQSMSPEFASLLKIYVQDKDGIEVEIVPWGPLPETILSDDDPLNPNNLAYRTEVGTALNDCALRTRAKAKYMASLDVDEIIITMKENYKLLELIEIYANMKLPNNSQYGEFLFRHSYAEVETNFSAITHPSQFSFENYKNVKISKKIWPVGQRTKIIIIPEAVEKTHVHSVHKFESRHWKRMVIPPTEGKVLHFRQVSTAANTNETYENSTLLKTFVDKWNDNFQKRINRALIREQESDQNNDFEEYFKDKPSQSRPILGNKTWTNRGKVVLQEVENCRETLYKNITKQCSTQWTCKNKMKSIAPTEWVIAKNKWVLV